MPDTHPVLRFRYCPVCGSNSFVGLDKKSSECKRCQFRLYYNSGAAVAALVEVGDDRLILTKRASDPHKGMLDLPGGFVDPSESAEGALIREIREELGVPVSITSYLGSFPGQYVYKGLTYFNLDLAFICSLHQDYVPQIVASDDVAECVIKNIDMIMPEEIGLASVRAVVETYLKFRSTQARNS